MVRPLTIFGNIQRINIYGCREKGHHSNEQKQIINSIQHHNEHCQNGNKNKRNNELKPLATIKINFFHDNRTALDLGLFVTNCIRDL